MDTNGRIDRMKAVNLQLKDDLGYSWFQDREDPKDRIVNNTKPF
jgi:hypothetical protein